MDQLQRAIQLGEFRNLRNDAPPLLPECRRLLATALDDLMTQTGLDISQIVLGGFSQGSMLATDVTLHLEQAPAALVVWSGTLLNAHAWEKLVSRRTGLPVLQSHGRQDLILPYAAARWLEELFVKAGLQVQFLTFDGGHTIPWEALEATAELLRNIILSKTDPEAL
jgi:phospholipase/carboxylesterase